ncbi:MAG: hypothetical protein ICV59_05830 [Thermoleophilia bacterium]|nr:hypothetical protein [Thermoleophilia bacterium]
MTLVAPDIYIGERAASRLLADCAALAWLQGPPGPTGRERLERALGGTLADRLVSALAGDHRMRVRELVA